MEQSAARRTIARARKLVDLSESNVAVDREAAFTLLEAAIVFARSVTFHLQKDFSDQDGFEDWYAKKRVEMGGDPLCAFILNLRNAILKQGPASMTRHVTASIHLTVTARVRIDAVLIRGQPWYRRNPRILWQDLSANLRAKRRSARATAEPKEPDVPPRKTAKVSHSIVFDDPIWSDQTATDLLRKYLNILEPIVDDAEVRFSAH